jgi:hypothetical protein
MFLRAFAKNANGWSAAGQSYESLRDDHFAVCVVPTGLWINYWYRQPSAEQAVTKLGIWSEIARKHPSVAKASVDSIGLTRGLKPPSPSALSFVTDCEALG